MKIIKFTSLDNTYRQEILNKIEMHGLTLPQEQWMVTEKLHGANVGIYCDGENLKAACRTKMLEDGESFFDIWNALKPYKKPFLSHAKDVLDDVSNLLKLNSKPYMIYFGELFGGSVQKNMPYSQKQDIRLYDSVIVVDRSEDVEGSALNGLLNGNGRGKLFGYVVLEDKILLLPSNKLTVREEWEDCGLKAVPLVGVGTFDEVMQLTNDFESDLTDHEYVDSLNLPDDHRILRCKSEGLVIEPVEARCIVQDRVYLKNKSSKFEEKKRIVKKNVTEITLDNLSAHEAFAYQEISARICENRLESVVSKIGEVFIQDINKVCGLFIQDAFEEFEKDELTNMVTGEVTDVKTYLGKNFKAVLKVLHYEAVNVAKPFLLGK